MARGPFVVPWIVAEAVALRVARADAVAVRIVGDTANRLVQVCQEASLDARPLRISTQAGGNPTDVLVYVGVGTSPNRLAQSELVAEVPGCTGEVVFCEPSLPGMGLGRSMMRRIDPGLTQLLCEEVPNAQGGTRLARMWEAPDQWLVASAAAWRFEHGAQEIRAGLRARLPRMSAEKMVMACRRLLQRFETAFELFALAAEELSRRHDAEGVRLVQAELALSTRSPFGIRARLRRAFTACRYRPQPRHELAVITDQTG